VHTKKVLLAMSFIQDDDKAKMVVLMMGLVLTINVKLDVSFNLIVKIAMREVINSYGCRLRS